MGLVTVWKGYGASAGPLFTTMKRRASHTAVERQDGDEADGQWPNLEDEAKEAQDEGCRSKALVNNRFLACGSLRDGASPQP